LAIEESYRSTVEKPARKILRRPKVDDEKEAELLVHEELPQAGTEKPAALQQFIWIPHPEMDATAAV